MWNVVPDLRYGAYAMVKRPAFTATAVLTLALGIGAGMSVVFAGSRFVLPRPDGVTDADRLMGISQQKGVRPISEVIFSVLTILIGSFLRLSRFLWSCHGGGSA